MKLMMMITNITSEASKAEARSYCKSLCSEQKRSACLQEQIDVLNHQANRRKEECLTKAAKVVNLEDKVQLLSIEIARLKANKVLFTNLYHRT